MIKLAEKALENMTIYLEPYKYKCISRPIEVRPNASKETKINDSHSDFSYYHDDTDINGDYLQRIWFRIITPGENNEPIEVGYITGYYVNADNLAAADLAGVEEEEAAFIAFDDISQLTLDLYNDIMAGLFEGCRHDFYFLNSISVKDEYLNHDLIIAAIKAIPIACYDIYGIEVGTIIYSFGATEDNDDTVIERDETYWEKHHESLLDAGFAEVSKDDEVIYMFADLSEDYEWSNSAAFEALSKEIDHMFDFCELPAGSFDDELAEDANKRPSGSNVLPFKPRKR